MRRTRNCRCALGRMTVSIECYGSYSVIGPNRLGRIRHTSGEDGVEAMDEVCYRHLKQYYDRAMIKCCHITCDKMLPFESSGRNTRVRYAVNIPWLSDRAGPHDLLCESHYKLARQMGKHLAEKQAAPVSGEVIITPGMEQELKTEGGATVEATIVPDEELEEKKRECMQQLKTSLALARELGAIQDNTVERYS